MIEAGGAGRHRRWLKWLSIAYIVFLHAVIVVALVKSNLLLLIGKTLDVYDREEQSSDYYRELVVQLAVDATVAPGAVVFLGDSITHDLDVTAVVRPAVNFGLGGDTTNGLLARLPLYRSITGARAIVLAIGVNDLRYRSPSDIEITYRKLLAALPPSSPVVLGAVLPVDEAVDGVRQRKWLRNATIRRLNDAIANLCIGRAGCVVADAGPALGDTRGDLAGDFHQADGWHLSPAGYRVWGEVLAKALTGVSR